MRHLRAQWKQAAGRVFEPTPEQLRLSEGWPWPIPQRESGWIHVYRGACLDSKPPPDYDFTEEMAREYLKKLRTTDLGIHWTMNRDMATMMAASCVPYGPTVGAVLTGDVREEDVYWPFTPEWNEMQWDAAIGPPTCMTEMEVTVRPGARIRPVPYGISIIIVQQRRRGRGDVSMEYRFPASGSWTV